MAMAGEDEHAHSSPNPVIVSASTTDRAVMSQSVVGAGSAVGLNETTPRTSGSGVDGQSVSRHGQSVSRHGQSVSRHGQSVSRHGPARPGSTWPCRSFRADPTATPPYAPQHKSVRSRLRSNGSTPA